MREIRREKKSNTRFQSKGDAPVIFFLDGEKGGFSFRESERKLLFLNVPYSRDMLIN